MTMRALFTMLFAFLVATVSVIAQVDQQATEDPELQKSYLYQWTDGTGGVHITDGLGKVPKKYRGKARKLEAPKNEEEVQCQQPQESISSSSENEERSDQGSMSEWRGRLQDAKKRLADAKQRYRTLDQQRTALLAKFGSPVYAPSEDRLEAERIAGEMQEVQKEIDDARNDVEVVIPEEARKAGVPPGWLRE